MNRIAQTLLGMIALVSSATFAAELKYSIAPNFFEQNPDHQPLGPCHGGVVIDKTGDIYVTTDTPRGIVVFSRAGKFLRAVGPTRIHGLELRAENGTEYLYCARASDHEVVKLRLDGEPVWAIHFPEEAGIYKDAKGFNPCAVTVAPDGSIFVADGYGSNYVLKFDKDRKFVKAFGGPGEAEGKFKTCHGIALDTRPGKALLLVCNRNNNRVEYWDLDGNIVAQVGDNPNEKQRANFGLAQDQWQDGICNSPHGASIDKDGNLIVSEWSQFGHLHKFTRVK